MNQFVREEWQRARKSLDSAEQLLSSDPDSSASRAYYAAFHAVTALFALRGYEFSKHREIRAAVHRDLIKTGEWMPELGKDYDFLMDLRETGDCGGLARVSTDDAKQAAACATKVLDAVLKAQPNLGGGKAG